MNNRKRGFYLEVKSFSEWIPDLTATVSLSRSIDFPSVDYGLVLERHWLIIGCALETGNTEVTCIAFVIIIRSSSSSYSCSIQHLSCGLRTWTRIFEPRSTKGLSVISMTYMSLLEVWNAIQKCPVTRLLQQQLWVLIYAYTALSSTAACRSSYLPDLLLIILEPNFICLTDFK